MSIRHGLRRGKTGLRDLLGDPLDDYTVEMVHTVRLPALLRPLPPGTPQVVHEARAFFQGVDSPVVASLCGWIILEILNEVSPYVSRIQNMRESFALVNRTYQDALFLGGIHSREIIEDETREPYTIWLLTEFEYTELTALDPDVFLKALGLVDCPPADQ